MFENIGWAEILVLVVAGLFILGPERLPQAAQWLGKTVRQVREYATGARDHLRNELGPEFDQIQQPLNDLRSLRSFNPRTAITRTLFSDDDGPTKPNGYAPGPNGSATNGSATNGSAANGSGTNGSATTGPATNGSGTNGSSVNGAGTGAAANGAATAGASGAVATPPASTPQAPMSSGERPPIDPDAT